MNIVSDTISIKTQGNTDIVNITDPIRVCAQHCDLRDGLVHLFVIGSTAGLTTTEYEPGLVNHDLAAGFEIIAPEHGNYEHEHTWHDDNGHSHVRAALLGPSMTLPLIDRQIQLGTWQQVVLIDFDTRPRQRKVIVQIFGR